MKTILGLCLLAAVATPSRAIDPPTQPAQPVAATGDPVVECSKQTTEVDLKKLTEGADPAHLSAFYGAQKKADKDSPQAGCSAFIAQAKDCSDPAKNSGSVKACWEMASKLATGVPVKLDQTASMKNIKGKCGDKLYTGAECSSLPIVPGGNTTMTPAQKKALEEAAAAKTAAEQKAKEKAAATVDVPPAGAPGNGDTPTKVDKAPDPNKWNDTIAGGKMAIWAGLIGFVLGGPMGMLVCAMAGFGAGYFIHKMS